MNRSEGRSVSQIAVLDMDVYGLQHQQAGLAMVIWVHFILQVGAWPMAKGDTMQYRKLGATGLVVSEVAYGSWITFQNQVDPDLASRILGRAFALGINYIDTADVYELGAAETMLGRLLSDYNPRQYVLATKSFWPMSDAPTDRGLSRKHLFDSLEGSLERLRRRSVDLFYCHRYDSATPLRETVEAMEDLVRLGRVHYWGVSEWTAEQIREAVALCDIHGWHRPVVHQPQYNLLHRGIEKGALPVCKDLGLGSAVFSPLAQGVLTGKYSGGKIPDGSRGSDVRLGRFMADMLGDQKVLAHVDRMAKMARAHSCTPGQFALAWALRDPGISSVIVGATSVEQLEENAAASDIRLTDEEVAALDQLFPV